MKELEIKIEGMMCNGCENRVQNGLKQIEGIENVIANHENGTVKIESNTDIDINVIKEKIEDLGYKIID